MNAPRADVLLSTYNERRDVDACLDALFAQTVPFRLTVIDGGSTDGTVARLRERAATFAGMHVIAEGCRLTLPAALNTGLARTSLPFVAKVDARTFVAPDFLERALALLADSGDDVAAAGGAPQQYGETPFGAAFALARTSRFGVGGSQYADARPHADVDTVQCGVYRRAALDAVGHFDPELQFGEDEELNWRLRRAGYRLVRDASVRFRYLTRPTWRKAFAQYRNYGRARVAVWRRHRAFLRWHHTIPAAALSAAAVTAAAAPFVPAAGVALAAGAGAYAAAAAAAAVATAGVRTRALAVASAFGALHAGYAIGTLEGLVSTLRWRSTR